MKTSSKKSRVAVAVMAAADELPRRALPPAAASGAERAEEFWEAVTARELGVARRLVSMLRRRHLAEGTEWRRRGNSVVLTGAGMARIRALLRGEGQDRPASENERNAPHGPPERVKMRVARLCPNVRLIVCQPIADGPDATSRLVRVRENVNFMPGMVLEAVSCGANLWQFTGRLPRRKGHW